MGTGHRDRELLYVMVTGPSVCTLCLIFSDSGAGMLVVVGSIG